MKQETVMLILLIAFAFATGFFARGNLSAGTIIPPNLVTQQLQCAENTVTGAGATGNNIPGQLLDQQTYIASWSPNLIGQRITAIAAIQLEANNKPWYVVNVGVDVVKIQMLLDQGSGPVPVLNSTTQLPTARVGNGWFQVANAYWDIQSIDGKTIVADHSVLTVQFVVHAFWILPWPLAPVDKGWCIASSDQAWVLSGIGNVGWDRSPALYAIGMTATANYQIPYTTDTMQGRGWDIRIASCAQNYATVFGPTTLTQLQGSVRYTVQPADFNAAAPANCLFVYLRNELWSKDFGLAATIDNVTLAPSISVTGVSPQSPHQGQSVTINFTAIPNPITRSAIKEIDIWYGWGSPDNHVVLNGTATSFSFLATQSGYVKVAVTCYDAVNRPCGATNLAIQIEHQPNNPCLGNPAVCINSGFDNSWLLWLFMFILGVVLFGIGATLPPPFKTIFVITGAALLAIGMFLLAATIVAAVRSILHMAILTGGLP